MLHTCMLLRASWHTDVFLSVSYAEESFRVPPILLLVPHQGSTALTCVITFLIRWHVLLNHRYLNSDFLTQHYFTSFTPLAGFTAFKAPGSLVFRFLDPLTCFTDQLIFKFPDAAECSADSVDNWGSLRFPLCMLLLFCFVYLNLFEFQKCQHASLMLC